MSLVVLGTNHKTAKINLRERWSYQVDEVVTTLESLSEKLNTSNIAILSTCNRTEVYCDINQADDLINWFNQEISPITDISLDTHGYVYQNQEAVSHIMRVASGLDSMVIGEPQILGQFKQAYRLAKKAKTIGKKLDKLFTQAFSVAKSVRSNTEIGLHAMSVASVSSDILSKEFNHESIEQLEVLLIGSGDTTKTVGRSLIKQGIYKISIANRNQLHAHDLSDDLVSYAREKFGKNISVNVYPLSIINNAQDLVKYNVIFTATMSPVPLITKDIIEQVQLLNRNTVISDVEPRSIMLDSDSSRDALDRNDVVKSIGSEFNKLLLIDLAVPRDIEPECSDLKSVCLYTVDDLEMIINKNNIQRQESAIKAQEIINNHVNEFCTWENSLSVMASLCQYREQAEQMCDEIIERAHKRIDAGHDTKEVLVSSLQQLRNKLLHHPTMTLKSFAENNNTEMGLIKDIFNL